MRSRCRVAGATRYNLITFWTIVAASTKNTIAGQHLIDNHFTPSNRTASSRLKPQEQDVNHKHSHEQ
ncbi:unnamed protein product [Pleuronectes platessa]|uniref:Uncharacterized protein n=1 Tax=Pleuronectes platessa TaxID=8262 RepID=A0A9N7V3Z1_PLEPL|nr:unnamed protein product [Pleuronectes platessa]